MIFINSKIIIERYYRGAQVYLDGKIYCLSESLIQVIEKVQEGATLHHETFGRKDLLNKRILLEGTALNHKDNDPS